MFRKYRNKSHSFFLEPNLFIIGAPRCGTTALSKYLSEHPNIFFFFFKELNFFNADFNRSSGRYLSYSEYLKAFFRITRNYKIVAEGSIFYLYSKVAVPNILKKNPSAKFLIMLRNPIEVAFSLHQKCLFWGFENEKDFSRAWALQKERRKGNKLPLFCKNPELLQYGEICKFGEQLARFYKTGVNRKNVFIVIYEDFKNNPKKVWEQIMAFLELEDDGREDFPIINKSSEVKYLAIRRFIRISVDLLSVLMSRNVLVKVSRKMRLFTETFFSFFTKYSNFIQSERGNRKNLDKKKVNRMDKVLAKYFKQDILLLNKIIQDNSFKKQTTKFPVINWLTK